MSRASPRLWDCAREMHSCIVWTKCAFFFFSFSFYVEEDMVELLEAVGGCSFEVEVPAYCLDVIDCG